MPELWNCPELINRARAHKGPPASSAVASSAAVRYADVADAEADLYWLSTSSRWLPRTARRQGMRGMGGPECGYTVLEFRAIVKEV